MNWISVRDKYPSVESVVLVYSPGHGYYVAEWDGCWSDADTMINLDEIDITHWVELTPPQ
jgi:hypothetical protein